MVRGQGRGERGGGSKKWKKGKVLVRKRWVDEGVRKFGGAKEVVVGGRVRKWRGEGRVRPMEVVG